jgi:predicted lipid-binding transport protein (Tim44 family)
MGVPPGAAPVPPAAGPVGVVLEYESNVTVGTPGAERTQYLRERWTLVRSAAVRSKPPDKVGSFHCPNCGAPFQSAGGGRCSYCNQVVTDGRFDWSVQSITVLAAEDRPPALTGTVEEVGTDFPTISHPQVAARRAQLLQDDPAATDEALEARLRLLYDQLNAAWTKLDLKPARPYVSDSLFEYLQYWIDAYRRQGLRNILEGMHITRSALAKVVRDKYFDSLTFRLWATGHDSTIRQDNGQVVAGNPRADRAYSEYWTLIRGAGVRGAPQTDHTCPNCGAPLTTNMAGDCEHCGAKLTRGDFDWVLSKIEQDDSYTG